MKYNCLKVILEWESSFYNLFMSSTLLSLLNLHSHYHHTGLVQALFISLLDRTQPLVLCLWNMLLQLCQIFILLLKSLPTFMHAHRLLTTFWPSFPMQRTFQVPHVACYFTPLVLGSQWPLCVTCPTLSLSDKLQLICKHTAQESSPLRNPSLPFHAQVFVSHKILFIKKSVTLNDLYLFTCLFLQVNAKLWEECISSSTFLNLHTQENPSIYSRGSVNTVTVKRTDSSCHYHGHHSMVSECPQECNLVGVTFSVQRG